MLAAIVLLILLAALCSPIYTQRNFTESVFKSFDGTDLFLEQIIRSTGSEEKFELQIKNTHQLYIDVTGFGTVRTLTYKANYSHLLPNGEPILVLLKETVCSLYGTKICWIWSTDPHEPDSLEIFTVKLHVTASVNSGAVNLKFKVMRSAIPKFNSASRLYMDVQNVKSLDFQVDLSKLDTGIPPKEGKIQFYAMRNWGNFLSPATFLRMYAKQGTEIATAKNTNFKASSTIGQGTVITIIPSDPDFCWRQDCTYMIHLDMQDISFIEFLIEIFDRKTKIEFRDQLMLFDQLRENDEATYEIVHTADSQPVKGGSEYIWRFIVSPIEGDADISINPDILPAVGTEPFIKSNLNSVENILLNSKQLYASGRTGSKFYVHMNSTKQSTFIMRLNRWGIDDTPFLVPEHPVTSELVKGQITNYRADFKGSLPEVFTFVIDLKVFSGNPNLYVKECRTNDLNCTVSEQDTKNAKILAQDKNQFFRYSSNLIGDEKLMIKIACIPDAPEYKDFSFKDDPTAAGIYTSRTCKFAVSVVGEPSSVSQLSRYRIQLTGSGPQNILMLNGRHRFQIEKNMVLYFTLDLTLESMIGANNSAAADSKYYLRFWFLILSGDCDIYFSSTNPKPSEGDHDRKVLIDNVNDQLHASQRVADFQNTAKKLTGKYFIAIKARDRLFGSLSVNFLSVPFPEYLIVPERELRFGETVLERMEARLTEKQLYYFNLDVPNNQKLVEIVLQLTPIQGLFFYCVSNQVQRIHNITECKWSSDPESSIIVIKDSDAGFTRKGRYAVAVFPEFPVTRDPLNSSQNEISPPLYTYSLGLGAENTFTEILEGLPHKMPFLNGTPRLLRVAVNAEIMYLTLTSNDEKAILEIAADPDLIRSHTKQPGNDNVHKPSEVPHSTIQGQFSGAIFTKEKLAMWCKYQNESSRNVQSAQTQCYLYMKVWPGDKKVHEYTIMAFTKSSTNYLTEGTVSVLAAPVKLKVVLQHQPISGTKGMYFNVFSEAYRMKVFLTVRDLDDIGAAIPSSKSDTFVVNDLNTNVIFVDSSVLSKYKRPFIYVELENQDYTANPKAFDDEDFDMKERVYIQISNGITRLTHLVPIEDSTAKKGFFKYYKFTKRSDFIGMIYLQVKSGEVDLYATKGDSKWPDLNFYDFKSDTVKGDELMLPAAYQESSKLTYNDNYIIGVYAREDSKYQILGSKNSEFMYLQITPGEIQVKDITPMTYLLLSFYNKNNVPFYIGVSGKSNGVTVSYRAYDELTNLDFLQEEPNGNQDPTHTTKLKNVVERVSVTPSKAKNNLNQYLIQIKTVIATQISVFVVYSDTVLKVPDGLQLTETFSQQQCQTYELFYTDQSFADQLIKFDTLSGSTKLSVYSEYIKAKPDLEKEFSSPTAYKFKLADAMIQRNLTYMKFPVFREIFLRACGTNSNRSTVSLVGQSSNRKIVEIHAGERATLSFSSDASIGANVYYFKLTETVSNITLIFDLPESGLDGKVSDLSTLESLLSIGSPQNESDWWKSDTHNYNIRPIAHTTQQFKSSRGLLINYLFQSDKGQGYIILAKKSGVSQELNVTFQLITNDVRPISVRGQTTQEIAPGTSIKMELIRPPHSDIILTMSNCKGLTRVEILEIFIDSGSQPTTKIFKLGYSTDAKNRSELLQTGNKAEDHIILKGDSIYITATSLSQEKPSLLILSPQVMTGSDALTLRDFFRSYELGNSEDSILKSATQKYVTVSSEPSYFSVTVHPLVPSLGFEQRAREFAELSIKYSMLAGDFTLISEQLSSVCPAEVDRASSEPIHDYVEHTAERTYRMKDGKYEETPSPITLTPINYPRRARPPFKAILQTTLTFRGPYSAAADDDAIIILKRAFTVPVTNEGFVASALTLGTVATCFIFILIVTLVIYYLVRRRENRTYRVSRSTELGNIAVQDTASNSANSHEDSDGMRSPNMTTQVEEISLKSGEEGGPNKQSSLDNTL